MARTSSFIKASIPLLGLGLGGCQQGPVKSHFDMVVGPTGKVCYQTTGTQYNADIFGDRSQYDYDPATVQALLPSGALLCSAQLAGSKPTAAKDYLDAAAEAAQIPANAVGEVYAPLADIALQKNLNQQNSAVTPVASTLGTATTTTNTELYTTSHNVHVSAERVQYIRGPGFPTLGNGNN